MNCTTRLLMHISCRLLIACENEYYTNDKKRQFCSVLACYTPNQIRTMHAVRSTWMVIACEMSITQMIRKRKFCSVFDCYCSTRQWPLTSHSRCVLGHAFYGDVSNVKIQQWSLLI